MILIAIGVPAFLPSVVGGFMGHDKRLRHRLRFVLSGKPDTSGGRFFKRLFLLAYLFRHWATNAQPNVPQSGARFAKKSAAGCLVKP